MQVDSKPLAAHLLFNMRQRTVNHLLGGTGSTPFSGHLEAIDILEIQRITRHKVTCSVESGEYFFKLGRKLENSE